MLRKILGSEEFSLLSSRSCFARYASIEIPLSISSSIEFSFVNNSLLLFICALLIDLFACSFLFPSRVAG